MFKIVIRGQSFSFQRQGSRTMVFYNTSVFAGNQIFTIGLENEVGG